MKNETISRRKMLQTLAAAGGGVTAAAFLPVKWVKPMLQSGVLPVYAAAAGGGGSISIIYEFSVDPDGSMGDTNCGESSPYYMDIDDNFRLMVRDINTGAGVNGITVTMTYRMSPFYNTPGDVLTVVKHNDIAWTPNPDGTSSSPSLTAVSKNDIWGKSWGSGGRGSHLYWSLVF